LANKLRLLSTLRRIVNEGKIYCNEIVGECLECNCNGIILEYYPEEVCIDSDGTDIIYFRKENIN